ncbi:protein TolR [Desulfobacterota bacterium AH_259_B03_O07]|nr:protein TolR [Desulfobacterota bacterium AH_259_B03_O07]
MAINNKTNGRTVLSEINVTPFVDVMLVLLIIFMVTAPILYQGVDINLPKVDSRPLPAAEREKKIVITLNEKGEIFIERKKYSLTELKLEIRSLIRKKGKDIIEEDVFLRADSKVPYGTVMEIMAEIKKAGVNKLGLVTEPPLTNNFQTKKE